MHFVQNVQLIPLSGSSCMITKSHGGLAIGLKGIFCRVLCRFYDFSGSLQNCEDCTHPDKCESLFDEVETYLEDIKCNAKKD